MRPNTVDLLQGVRGALRTYVLPEVQSDFARTELMLVDALLGIAASDWDAAAQRLFDGNGALRDLAQRAAETLDSEGGQPALASELRALAAETDASLLLSDLSAANDRLHDALGRLAAGLEGTDRRALQDLRSAITDRLREETESRARSLLGPRAEG
jgi:hypothetical protein